MSKLDYSNYVFGTSNNREYLVNPKTGRIAIFRSVEGLEEAMKSCTDFMSTIKHNLFIEAKRLDNELPRTKVINRFNSIKRFYTSKNPIHIVMHFDDFLELAKSYDKLRFLVEQDDSALKEWMYEPLEIASDNIVTSNNIESENNDCAYELDTTEELTKSVETYYTSIRSKMRAQN